MIEYLKELIDFLKAYRKWYKEYTEAQANDGGPGPNPPSPPPPPPKP